MITLDIETSETDMLCFGCNLAMWLKVLHDLGEQGLLEPSAQTAQQG